MTDFLLLVAFIAAAGVSLISSWQLIARLERVGAGLGLSESLLGMLAALAGDAPEITAAVAALASHETHIGAGIVIGSNVFNLAALLGLSAVVAGRVALHRRVIEMNGAVGVWVAGTCLLVVVGTLSPLAGLVLAVAVLGPYLAVLGVARERLARLPLPASWSRWLGAAIAEEEFELEVAIHPSRGGPRDAAAALVAVAVVVAASVGMERAASTLGSHQGIPDIVIGGLVLAAVTSLPNAVAAVYLASRGRGAAVLSTALNSNALNVVGGLLIPGAIVGLGASSSETTSIACWYLGLTLFTLLLAYADRGLRRPHGAIVVGVYVVFVATLVATSSA